MTTIIYATRDGRAFAGLDLDQQFAPQQVVDIEAGRRLVMHRVTRAFWAALVRGCQAEAIAPIRAALVAAHGEAAVAASTPAPAQAA